MKILLFFLFATSSFFAFNLFADTADLDDIKLYDIVKVEQCLDQAYDKIAGHARKLNLKLKGMILYMNLI